MNPGIYFPRSTQLAAILKSLGHYFSETYSEKHKKYIFYCDHFEEDGIFVNYWTRDGKTNVQGRGNRRIVQEALEHHSFEAPQQAAADAPGAMGVCSTVLQPIVGCTEAERQCEQPRKRVRVDEDVKYSDLTPRQSQDPWTMATGPPSPSSFSDLYACAMYWKWIIMHVSGPRNYTTTKRRWTFFE